MSYYLFYDNAAINGKIACRMKANYQLIQLYKINQLDSKNKCNNEKPIDFYK